MIKNLIVIVFAAALLASCTKPVKNEFVINGTVDSVFDGFVMLQKRLDAPMVTLDSTRMANGKFQFRGTIEYPEVYYINIPGTKSLVPFFIEAKEININVSTRDINKSKIVGSEAQKEYDAYLDMLDQYNAKVRENYQMYLKAQETGDPDKAQYFDSLASAYDEERNSFTKNFVIEKNKSFISPYIVYRNSWAYEMEDLEKVLNNFDTSLSHSVYTGILQDYLSTLKRTAVGMPYVTFMMQDSTGIFVPIADLVGNNYLLVDFWASWCSPCRAENPNLVAMYSKYHDKGFDILGISLDSSRERWLQAIKDDNLTWHHVSDLAGWDNKAAKMYGVRSIPANVLLNPSGIIIAKNLRGEDLEAKLAEIFPETAAR